jgi:anti-sigma B factor antagonist
MSEINPKIGVEYIDNTVVATLLLEKILEQSDIQVIQDSIMPLIDEKSGVNLVIDFSDVRFLSSSVLGLLIRISKKIYETAGQLRLCSIDAKINEIFKITRLDKVFQILPDKESAISDLK